MPFEGGFTFSNFVADAFTIFMFILWFWLLIVVSGDLFRQHDVSGFAKVLWVIAFILFSYLGVFAYLLTQGRGMAERNRAQASEAREELRHIVGFSAVTRSKLEVEVGGLDYGAGIRAPQSQAGPVAAAARTVLARQPSSCRTTTCDSTRPSKAGASGRALCASIAKVMVRPTTS
jgi:cbb3-type cytochrome oxidase subunit 3